jgi:hypothetical protein
MADTQLTPEQQAAKDAELQVAAQKADEEKAVKQREADQKKADELRAQLAELETKIGPSPKKASPLTVLTIPEDSSATAHVYGGKFYAPGQALGLDPKNKEHAELITQLKTAKILPAE